MNFSVAAFQEATLKNQQKTLDFCKFVCYIHFQKLF